MLLISYLFAGLLIGFIFGVATGKMHVAIYMDEETNDKIEKIRKQRVAVEQARLEFKGAKTLEELQNRAVELLNDLK